jgi:hypothetical protein
MNIFSKEFWERHQPLAIFLIFSVIFLAILGIAYLICIRCLSELWLTAVYSVLMLLIIIFCKALSSALSESFHAKLAVLSAMNVAHIFGFTTLAIYIKFPVSPGTFALSLVFWNFLYFALPDPNSL